MDKYIQYKPFGSLLKNIVDNRGKTCPTAEYGIPLIATNCIINNSLYPLYEKVRYVSDETYKTWFRGHPEPGDMIFVLKGTPGRVAWVPDPVDFCIAQDMVAIRANENEIYPKYLFAILRSELIQQEIEGLHVGSLIPHFKKGDFDVLKIPIINQELQKYIGDYYFDFSLKIDLLHRQNKTLESMAETLFRKWFIEDAEEDWEIDELKFYVEVVDNRGKTPPNQEISTNYPLIEANALNGDSRIINYSVIKKYVTKETFSNWFRNYLNKHDTVITTVGANIGAMAMFIIEKGNIAQNIIGISAKGISPFYLYQLLKYNKNEVLQLDIGGVQPSIKVPHLLSMEIIIPPTDLQNRFDTQMIEFITKMENNYKQICTLEKLRDTLLPKLMSGDVRVSIDK